MLVVFCGQIVTNAWLGVEIHAQTFYGLSTTALTVGIYLPSGFLQAASGLWKTVEIPNGHVGQ